MLLSLGPPIIKLTRTEFAVNVTDSVTFICNTEAYPSVTSLVWQKEVDGVTTSINSGFMKTSLTLTNVDMDDSGQYRCLARNAEGSANMSFTLKVTTGNSH